MALGDARPRRDVGERQPGGLARQPQLVAGTRNRQFALLGALFVTHNCLRAGLVCDPMSTVAPFFASTMRRSQMKFGERCREMPPGRRLVRGRSEEHTSALQSLMRISYAVFCWKKQNRATTTYNND